MRISDWSSDVCSSDLVGGERCPVLDTWWQTETGAHMITPLPGVTPLKPGSSTLPLPSIAAAVVDEAGEEVERGKGGFLVIKRPGTGMLSTTWHETERFQKSYFSPYHKGDWKSVVKGQGLLGR